MYETLQEAIFKKGFGVCQDHKEMINSWDDVEM